MIPMVSAGPSRVADPKGDHPSSDDCADFLQWALPQLRLRWHGFRKVRRQVCRRIAGRIRELGLPGFEAYRAHLEAAPGEWERLDALCHVTISRFYRDRGVFDYLVRVVLPELARQTATLEVWSAGCASGEEAYTLALVWQLELACEFPGVTLHVLATDVDEAMLRRARAAEYEPSSLRELPETWRRDAFVQQLGRYRLRSEYRRPVTVRRHDLRNPAPGGPFDLILCRNVAFTYFDLDLQRELATRLAACIRPGGALVLGAHETLPEGSAGFAPWSEGLRVYRGADAAA
jgi:chemotaxis protein methyltransferase CheR